MTDKLYEQIYEEEDREQIVIWFCSFSSFSHHFSLELISNVMCNMRAATALETSLQSTPLSLFPGSIHLAQNQCHRVFGREQDPQNCTAVGRVVKYMNSAQRWRDRTEEKQLVQMWKFQEKGIRSYRKKRQTLIFCH